ncbi:MAG: FkbM family methyltransferase [Gemmatimonadota bacterium]|jgi:FkbM family methyltransferase|nr:FkbM family methyltransferase [Gemmatimonadota bacterium]
MVLAVKQLIERVFGLHIHRRRSSGRCYYEAPFGIDLDLDLLRFREWADDEVIFDVGANEGSISHRLSRNFPAQQIYAFEPVRETFARLSTHTATLPNVHCFNFALGPESGTAEIRLHRKSDWNTLRSDVQHPGYEGEGSESIEVRTIDEFLAEQKIDRIHFLKIDTEGYDLEVLKGGERALSQGRIGIIQVEAGFDQDEGKFVPLGTFRTFLSSRDYLLFGLYHQAARDGRLRRCDAVFVHRNFR